MKCVCGNELNVTLDVGNTLHCRCGRSFTCGTSESVLVRRVDELAVGHQSMVAFVRYLAGSFLSGQQPRCVECKGEHPATWLEERVMAVVGSCEKHARPLAPLKEVPGRTAKPWMHTNRTIIIEAERFLRETST